MSDFYFVLKFLSSNCRRLRHGFDLVKGIQGIFSSGCGVSFFVSVPFFEVLGVWRLVRGWM